ncbi:MAG: UvrD-helicase domain-containing protein [bacterium]
MPRPSNIATAVATAPVREWSTYQTAIFEWVRSGDGDAVVTAVAGSGKTTTLIEAAQHLGGGRALFCAFNRHVAAELTRRLDGRMDCQTMNSIGYQTLLSQLPGRHWNLDDDKYFPLVNAALQAIPWPTRERRGQPSQYGRHLSATLKAIDLVRQTRTSIKDIPAVRRFVERWNLDLEPRELKWWHPLLREVLRQGTDLAKSQGTIDYTDQVFLPTLWKLTPRQYDWVFVDECQDLSAAQIELALAARTEGGRMLFVGDPRQAIYGFAGAEASAVAQLRERTKAIELPLSVTYRCQTVIAEQARLYAPALETPTNMAAGTTLNITPETMLTEASPGDLLLSRKTATAVEACLEFIGRKIAATVRGREIGRQLTDRVKAISALPGYAYEEFDEALADYQERELARLSMLPRAGEKIQLLLDQLKAIEVCHGAFKVTSVEALKKEILALFDNDNAVIQLSTVHKAKGLEANRVFLLDPHELPLVWDGQAEWEYEQELNLKYVAITRARETLFWVTRTPATPLELAARGLERAESTAAITPSTDSMEPLLPVGIAPPGGWRTGDWVTHRSFGPGAIVEIRNRGELLLVRFPDKDRMLASRVAPIQLLRR